MSCAGGSGVLHPSETAAPLEPPGDSPEEGERGGPSAAPPAAGSEGGRAEAGAGAGDQPETRSVCSSESGSGSNPGGAGPICKICFQGPEQVRSAGRARGAPAPRTDPPAAPRRRQRAGEGAAQAAPAAGRDQHRGQRAVPPPPGSAPAPSPAPPLGAAVRAAGGGPRPDSFKIHITVLPFQGELLNPCRCDGSVRYTHQLCLLKWISERGSWTCELCCYRYHVIAIKMKNPCQWQSITITLVEKVQMVAVILGSLFLVASVTWLLWSAFSPYAVWQRKDILFQICYGMYGFMDLVCIGLIVHEGASVYRVFKRWRAVNLHWDVLNYDKATDIEESNRGESSAGRTLWLPLTAFRNRNLVHPTQLTSPRFQCGYVLLHLFNRMRPQEDSSEDNSSGEVVMRVTSV
uniref:RING-type E3 ubiquitin transferase n=2 Tax=Dromaius novaehollandiae TaxID=8790 RepID=A0A8C4IWE7_DRONO